MCGRPAGWRVLADRARLGRPGSRLPLHASAAGLGGGISWRPPAYILFLMLQRRFQNKTIFYATDFHIAHIAFKDFRTGYLCHILTAYSGFLLVFKCVHDRFRLSWPSVSYMMKNACRSFVICMYNLLSYER